MCMNDLWLLTTSSLHVVQTFIVKEAACCAQSLCYSFVGGYFSVLLYK